MTKAHWAAIYNYCEKHLITKWDLLEALKENGTVERNTKLDELGDYVNGNTYDDMMCFLERNL